MSGTAPAIFAATAAFPALSSADLCALVEVCLEGAGNSQFWFGHSRAYFRYKTYYLKELQRQT